MTGQRKTQIRFLVGLLALIGMVSVARSAELVLVPQAAWGCELSDEKVVQGINAGLISRGWVITDRDAKGLIVAQIVVRNRHTLVIDIAYTNKTFDLTYKSSDSLNYKVKKDGTVEIHNNANRWMTNIRKDMSMQLAALCSL
jgi:hypothetical protein